MDRWTSKGKVSHTVEPLMNGTLPIFNPDLPRSLLTLKVTESSQLERGAQSYMIAPPLEFLIRNKMFRPKVEIVLKRPKYTFLKSSL